MFNDSRESRCPRMERKGKRYNADVLLELIRYAVALGYKRIVIDEDIITIDSELIACLINDGLDCNNCNRVGMIFVKEREPRKKGKWHLALYSFTKKKKEVLMTRDHIVPLDSGGSNHIGNCQTMCYQCNQLKGNKK